MRFNCFLFILLLSSGKLSAQELTGFVDMHAHPRGDLAYGSELFFGAPYGDISVALGNCNPYHSAWSAGNKKGNLLRQVLAQQTAAWNRGDLPGFMDGYWKSDSLMFIGKNGITYGWNNTLTNYKKNYPDTATMGKLRFEIILVKPLSFQYFHVVGKWHLQRTAGDLSGHFTLLFKKINDQWVIVADHSS